MIKPYLAYQISQKNPVRGTKEPNLRYAWDQERKNVRQQPEKVYRLPIFSN